MCYAMLKWIFVILDKFSKKMPLKMFLVKLKELKTVLFISFYKDQKSKKVLNLIFPNVFTKLQPSNITFAHGFVNHGLMFYLFFSH